MKEYQLFAYAQRKAGMEEFCIVSTQEISKKLNLSKKQTANLFGRLVRAGRIGLLMREFYIIPSKLPPGKKWKASAYVTLIAYMQIMEAQYQVSGLDTFRHYGLSTQIAQKIYVYNTKISGEKIIAGNRFTFVKISGELLGNTKAIMVPGTSMKLFYPTKSRVLFDAIYNYKKFNTIPQAYFWLKEIVSEKVTISEILDCALKYGNISTQRRIGFVLEKLGIKSSKLVQLQKKCQSKNVCSLLPESRKGRINEKWKLIENEDVIVMLCTKRGVQ